MIDPTTLIQAINTYLRINHEYRAAWRYAEKRDRLRLPRATAFLEAQQIRDNLEAQLNELAEPDFISRQTEELIRLWDARNRNFEIYRSEPNGHNLNHLNQSETRLKEFNNALYTAIQKLSNSS